SLSPSAIRSRARPSHARDVARTLLVSSVPHAYLLPASPNPPAHRHASAHVAHSRATAHAPSLSLTSRACAPALGRPIPTRPRLPSASPILVRLPRASPLSASSRASVLTPWPQSPTVHPRVPSALLPVPAVPAAWPSIAHPACVTSSLPDARSSPPTPVARTSVASASSSTVQPRTSWADARHSSISRSLSSLLPLVPVSSGHGSQPFNLTQSSAGTPTILLPSQTPPFSLLLLSLSFLCTRLAPTLICFSGPLMTDRSFVYT
ncbi:Unknown protein, partial [Striga hermonthica]